MLTLTYAQITPFLRPVSDVEQQKIEAWLPVIALILDKRYGDRITYENIVAFEQAAAAAIERRLDSPGLVDSQSIGGASVRYNSRALRRAWFLDEDFTDLDTIVGGGSIRSHRTPAPDGIRRGNMVPTPLEDDA